MENQIRTYIVNGFLDAGKTTYISDCIFHDFFHKRGTTLILAFEDGETEYDEARLREFRTDVVYYDDTTPPGRFISEMIDRYNPGRIYVEMNVMTEGLREALDPRMQVVFTHTLIDGTTLKPYFDNMRQLLQNMVIGADMVTFNRLDDKDALAPYHTTFKVMNSRASYLWKSPMGYSEKAFGNLLPYDISAEKLVIPEQDYAVFFIDTVENPVSYNGKLLEFDAQAEYREYLAENCVYVGRRVMTCCVLDIQNLGFECEIPEGMKISSGDWIHILARAEIAEENHIRKLRLHPVLVTGVEKACRNVIGLKI